MLPEYLIWWTNQQDCEMIRAFQADDLFNAWPQYIKDEFNSRFSRPGRGRLWGDGTAIKSWHDNLARYKVIGDSYGGIIIKRRDAHNVMNIPGFVTDTNLFPVLSEIKYEVDIP